MRSPLGELDRATAREIAATVKRRDPRHLVIRHDARTVTILLAQDRRRADREAGVRPLVEQAVDHARARNRASPPRGVIAAASVEVRAIGAAVRELRRLCGYIDHHHGTHERRVLGARSLELIGVLKGVDRRYASDFVAREIGPLLAYDAAHGTRLADLLEIGLDMPNHGQAARVANVHRNTLRRQLEHARRLIGSDLDDCDQRLAVHLALKLSHMLDTAPAEAVGAAAGRAQRSAAASAQPAPAAAAPSTSEISR